MDVFMRVLCCPNANALGLLWCIGPLKLVLCLGLAVLKISWRPLPQSKATWEGDPAMVGFNGELIC